MTHLGSGEYMRIAFVGKGGSGKSTLTASFASYFSKNTDKPVVVFDADLNIHAPELLGFGSLPFEKHLSHPKLTQTIQKWLIGENDIPKLGAFRKTTPPTSKSNLLYLENLQETPLVDFCLHRNNLSVFAVGTYQEDDIGASCYHNNLAILESILNHTDDLNGYVVADMVAGVDSFAGTLHAQFDLTCLIVEPTKRSIEVYEKYKELANEAGVLDGLMVIANKVRSGADKEFIAKHIEKEKTLGYFADDEHIRHIDQTEESIDVEKLASQNKELLVTVASKLNSLPDMRNERLKKLWDLHRKYVNQSFITDRFGDLTTQIDTEFSYRQVET
jgi:CO dehydrogenase maturation factor